MGDGEVQQIKAHTINLACQTNQGEGWSKITKNLMYLTQKVCSMLPLKTPALLANLTPKVSI